VAVAPGALRLGESAISGASREALYNIIQRVLREMEMFYMFYSKQLQKWQFRVMKQASVPPNPKFHPKTVVNFLGSSYELVVPIKQWVVGDIHVSCKH
jgi:hypothetical protein